MPELYGATTTPRVDIDTTIVSPTDRVRWGPIIAGLFAALSAMLILTLLGLAIGLSAVDANDRASSFGIGAGIWGAITALVAFFFGGWIAARMAAVRGGSNGAWQGAMVWMVAIPLLLYLLVGGLQTLLGTAGSVAGTAVDAGATVAGGAAETVDLDQAELASMKTDAIAATQQAANAASETITDIKQAVTPRRVEAVAGHAARGAWGTLISMVLGLVAAAVGGFVGVRERSDHVIER